MTKPILCYYTLSGINYKNGFVTSCPQQSDQLHVYSNTHIIKPSEIINSEGFKKHRKEMMSGTWSKGCHLCKEAEDIASHSMRQDYSADTQYYNDTTGEIDYASIRHIELRFSNACNMACLHCSDVYSSGWMSKLKNYQSDEEDKKYKIIQLTKTFHKQSPDEDLSISISMEEMEQIVDDLNLNFPNIEKIDFAGGEVLYQKQFFPCLERLSKHPNAKNIYLTFHTNFNTDFNPVRLAELLSKFKKGILHLSLDAGTNIYPYFRTGNWEVLKSNIKKFREVDKISDLSVVCTTSAYQIMDIENIFESFLTLDIDRIDASIAYTPRYMNPSVMTLKFKDAVYTDIQNTYKLITEEKNKRMSDIENYKHLRSWNPISRKFDDIESALNAVKFIEQYIFNRQSKIEDYDAFMIYIRKTDKIWKHNFNDYMKNYKFENDQLVRIKNV